MTARNLIGVALAGLALQACVVEADPPTGDLTLSWSFEGEDCISAGVSSVSVQIFDDQGNPIANNTFACSQGLATLTDLAVGSYGYDIIGSSGGGTILYEDSGNVGVNEGSNEYDLNLTIPP